MEKTTVDLANHKYAKEEDKYKYLYTPGENNVGKYYYYNNDKPEDAYYYVSNPGTYFYDRPFQWDNSLTELITISAFKKLTNIKYEEAFEKYMIYIMDYEFIGETTSSNVCDMKLDFMRKEEKYEFIFNLNITGKYGEENIDYTFALQYDIVYSETFIDSISWSLTVDKGNGYRYSDSFLNTMFKEFDEEMYNSLVSSIVPVAHQSGTNYSNLNLVYGDMEIFSKSYLPTSAIDFNEIKNTLRDEYHLDIKGFYYDKELTIPVPEGSTCCRSTNEKIYIDLAPVSGYTMIILESIVESVAPNDPDSYLTPELIEMIYNSPFDKVYYYKVVATNSDTDLQWSSILKNEYIYVDSTFDGVHYENKTVHLDDSPFHYFKISQKEVISHSGSSMKRAIDLNDVVVSNDNNGLLLTSFYVTSGETTHFYKIHTDDIKKNLTLEYTDYQSDKLIHSSEDLASCTPLSKVDLSVTFYINEAEVTSIPEGYSGDIYIEVHYSGTDVFHYLLIQ